MTLSPQYLPGVILAQIKESTRIYEKVRYRWG